MKSKLFSKHLKNNFLKYTVAFSATVHLIAFYLFPAWTALPAPDREKVIRVKAFLENKVKPVEKRRPEIKKNVTQKITPKAKTPDIYPPQPRPKSDIIEHAKAVMNSPSPANIRNPAPVRNSEETFKPVNTIQNNSYNPGPVAEIKAQVQLLVPQARQPIPRVDRSESQEPKVHSVISKVVISLQESSKTMNILNRVQSFQPAPQVARTFSSPETETPNHNVQIKNFSEKIFTAPSKPTGFTSAKKYEETRPLGQLGPRGEIQARTPDNLGSQLVAQYQPQLAIVRNYFSAPLQSANLLHKASIPSGFSEEILNPDEKLNTKPSAKVASLGGEVDNVSEDGLSRIKNGFSSQVRTKIAEVKYYPRIARDRGFEGQPVVAFTLGDRGELLELSIANASPFKLLDEAALDAIKSASPYPPIPALLKMKTIKFKVPIPFTLEER